MRMVRAVFLISVLFSAGGGFANSLKWYNSFLDDRNSAQAEVGLNVQCTENLVLTARGSLHGGQQFEQVGTDGIKDPYLPIRFQHSGLTAGDVAAGFESFVGKIGEASISGGGELSMKFRKVDDTSLSSFLAVSPAAMLNVSVPLGKSGAKAQLFNRLERRNFRSPLGPASYLRYNVQTRLTSQEFTPIKLAGYCYYEGYTQKSDLHVSGWGTGITFKPLDVIQIETAFTTLWIPIQLNTVVHQAELNITFNINCAGGK